MPRIEDSVRTGESPDDLILLLRGGPDTREKILRHADRTAGRYSYQGKPARGVSLWAARGDLDARAVLAARLSTYRQYYRVTGTALSSVGLLLATFEAPHWTFLFEPPTGASPRPEAEIVDDLLDILGPVLDNPKYEPRHGHRR